jgi:hypothetical protein
MQAVHDAMRRGWEQVLFCTVSALKEHAMPNQDTRAPRHDLHAERRQYGVVTPERITQADPASDTSDQLGIEIDHAQERPRTPDQPI